MINQKPVFRKILFILLFFSPQIIIASPNHDILGLTLNISPKETFNILSSKKYYIKVQTKKGKYAGNDNRFVESIVGTKKDDKIEIKFYHPPHDNVLARIDRYKKYYNKGDKYINKLPIVLEIASLIENKYGKPVVKNLKGAAKHFSWGDKGCQATIHPRTELQRERTHKPIFYYGSQTENCNKVLDFALTSLTGGSKIEYANFYHISLGNLKETISNQKSAGVMLGNAIKQVRAETEIGKKEYKANLEKKRLDSVDKSKMNNDF
jgi:hypothetical protein